MYNFLSANQWNVLVKKWKLRWSPTFTVASWYVLKHCFFKPSRGNVLPFLVNFLPSDASVVLWTRYISVAYYLPIEYLAIWNVRKRSIDFNCWALSVKHIIAMDVAYFLLISLLLFLFIFMMLLELCNLSWLVLALFRIISLLWLFLRKVKITNFNILNCLKLSFFLQLVYSS